MSRFRRWKILDFLWAPEGAVATEHALLLGLIAMVIFASVTNFGQTVLNTLYAVMAALPFGS